MLVAAVNIACAPTLISNSSRKGRMTMKRRTAPTRVNQLSRYSLAMTNQQDASRRRSASWYNSGNRIFFKQLIDHG